MATQALKTIIDALVTQLTTDVTSLNYITDSPLHSDELADDSKYPAVSITVGLSQMSDYVSSQMQFRVQANIRIFSKASQDELHDVDEAICDSLHSDPTLGGVCISALPKTADPPIVWTPSQQGQPFILDRQVEILYERDF